MQRLYASVLVAFALLQVPGAFARGHDFDADGRDDLFWRDADTGRNALWLSGNATTQRTVIGVNNLRWAVVGAGDFDGDGRDDLLWRQRTSGANVIWLSGNAGTPRAVASVADLGWQVAAVGDFDGDGRADVFWRHQRSGGNQLWRSADWTQDSGSSLGTGYVVAGIGDFDGDGTDDVLWRHRDADINVVWPSSNSARAQRLADIGEWWFHIEAVGDFDGDGRDDVLWRHLHDGRNVVWPAADGSRARSLVTVQSPAWHVASAGDVDGDNRDDLFWRNDDDGRSALWPAADGTRSTRPAAVANLAWSVAPYEAEPTMPRVLAKRPPPIVEGNSGTTATSVRMRLSHPSAIPVRLLMAAGPGPGPGAMMGEDFLWPSSNLEPVFAPGETPVDLPLSVVGDVAAEANEPIAIWPVTVDKAYVLALDATLTILNDDANTLWIDGARSSDEFEGTRPMHFVIHLSRPQTRDVTCFATTAAGTATADVDYVARSAQVRIPAGATEATFTVDIIGDTILDAGYRRGETFTVQLSQIVGVIPVLTSARGLIIDRSYRQIPP